MSHLPWLWLGSDGLLWGLSGCHPLPVLRPESPPNGGCPVDGSRSLNTLPRWSRAALAVLSPTTGVASLLGLSVHTCGMGMLTPASQLGHELSASRRLCCPVGWVALPGEAPSFWSTMGFPYLCATLGGSLCLIRLSPACLACSGLRLLLVK